jgi:hypothetical protein
MPPDHCGVINLFFKKLITAEVKDAPEHPEKVIEL